jgi:hypothetical protein
MIWILLAFLAIPAVKKYLDMGKDKDGRIRDGSVTVDNVIDHIEKFKPKRNQKLKFGYTEREIQKQLYRFLGKYYVHVTMEYGLEGLQGTKIDLDVGNGKVGLELKLAYAVYKSAGLQRLVGQIVEYQETKYNDDNLVVAVFGTKDEKNDRTMLKKVQERVESKDAHFYFHVLN